jgi:hypothetical protein
LHLWYRAEAADLRRRAASRNNCTDREKNRKPQYVPHFASTLSAVPTGCVSVLSFSADGLPPLG